jgi:hypothetical protein
VVRVDFNLTTKDSILESLEGFNDRKEFLLNCRIVLLCATDFVGIESYIPWNKLLGFVALLFLVNATAKLIITGVSLDLEGEVVIGIG